MRYTELEHKIIENLFNENCIIVNGKSGSGKTTLAMKKYRYMVENEGVNSEDILVLVMNRHQALTWRKELNLSLSGELKVYTYQNFIKRELIKFWPIVCKNCDEIKKIQLIPEFVSNDTAIYMMKLLVNYYRNKGYFMDITSTSTKIAEDLVSNISKAAISLVDLEEIGSRLYNSMQVKEKVRKENYEHIDITIKHYINSFLKQGVMDYGISTYIYNKYLINDESYIGKLQNTKYIIVDDLDEISLAQLNLINKLMCGISKAFLFNNPEGGFCTYFGADKTYLENNIDFSYYEVELEESFLCNKNFLEFADKLNRETLNIISQCGKKTPMNFDMSSQLRSEMIEKIAIKIKELVDKGKNPEDIAIIEPFNDFILSCEIEYKLKQLDIKVLNTSKKSRLIDNSYVHSLVTIACMCKQYNIKLTIDDYRRFFSIVLDIDVIKASILSKLIWKKNELQELSEQVVERIGKDITIRYNYLKSCIEEYKKEDMSLDKLFRRAFLELLIILPDAKKNILVCKNLSESAEKFIEALSQFDTMNNPESKFISYIKNEASDFYSLREIEELSINNKGVVLTTPYNLLTSNLKSNIQIYADISSNMWSPRNIKELTNTYVLRTNWNIDEVYTEEIEEQNRINNLILIIKCLIRKCGEEIYCYGSEYSINGYEQQGYFYDFSVDIYSEGDEIGAI
ncbi:ATP-binding protein [Clostridium thailandense]|uniref:ATP-binding protein n=1 Tax=Clostridium thailandense TaxID=2794346 RepID=UPI003988D508